MDKLKMRTPNKSDENFSKLVQLFPNAVTETINKNGEVIRAIDKDVLMQEISTVVVDGNEERYQFTWPDKKKSVLLANAPIAKTLRPCREESVDFDSTENLYIEGDNLEVLKLLQETYLNKVKMIYIDPPYNTGNDFVYEDDFAQSPDEYLENSGQFDEEGNRLVKNLDSNGRFHTNWLNMIYPRLKVAKDLLTDDGVIFVSIDDNEVHNLRKVCDEIFGESNVIAEMVWQTTPGSNTGTNIITVTEYVLAYAKSKDNCKFNAITITDESKYINEDEYVNKRGRYVLNKLDRRMTGVHYSEALNYPIKMPDGQLVYPGSTLERNNDGWNYRWSKTKVEWGIKTGFIVFKNVDGKWNAYFKQYFKVDNNDEPLNRSLPYQNLITLSQFNSTQGTKEVMKIFDKKFFDYPKPSEFVKYILSICQDKSDIIIDFFSGSATSAHAVMQLNAEDGGNRKFIMVQLPEETDEKSEAYKAGYKNICEIGKERIRRAGKKIKAENKDKEGIENFDIGFRVLKCDSSNMKDVYYSPADYKNDLFSSLTDNIKEDRTPEDLLFQVMLDLGVPLSSKIEESSIAGKKVFDVEDGFLIACFDENATEETIKTIAQKKPHYFVMRDSSMTDDNVATNFEQIFVTYSSDTIRKVL